MVVNFGDYGNLRSVQRNSANNTAFNKKFLQNFCGLKTIDRDTVELSSEKIKNSDKISEKPQYPLKVTIKDSEGNDVDAVITDITATPKLSCSEISELMLNPDIWNDGEKRKALLNGTYADKYLKDSTGVLELTVNNTPIGGINFYTKDNYIYVQYLYNNKQGLGYKGAGTELLKCAVKESIANGLNGIVKLNAVSNGTNSPIPFYYKNNLKFEQKSILQEALTLGVIQGKLPSEYICNTPCAKMVLDTEGAKALLEGKRLSQGSKFDKIDEKVINGNNCSAYLFESADGSNKCILIPYKNEWEELVFISVELEEQNNNKHFVITGVNGDKSDKDEFGFAMEIIEKLEKKYNLDKTTIKKGHPLRQIKKFGYSKHIDVE